MADPNPKRAKMDNPGTSTSNTRPDDEKLEIKDEERLINVGTQDFQVIRNMRGFVDHTHFIVRFLLRKEPKLAIFAPRRFGKSSHLEMVKTFLQIDVDQETGKASSPVDAPAEKRKNYKIFEGTRIITDGRYKNLVENHLGKHPVIRLDFKEPPSIASVEDAHAHCRKVVHKAYREHLYLKTSKKLEPGDIKANAECQEICEEWCSAKRYKTLDLECCLENLTRYLYNHFDGAKVYILVDEFDAINTSALCDVRENNRSDTAKELRTICTILPRILAPSTKGGEAHVAGALVTGVSYITGSGYYSSGMNNFQRFRFLEGDSTLPSEKGFVPFYGATEVEVRSLVEKLAQDDHLVRFKGNEKFHNDQRKLDVNKIMLDVESRYNGYLDKEGTRIFCLWSVLQYLQSGTPDNFWNQTDGLGCNIPNIFKNANIANYALKLLQDKTISFERLGKIGVWHLLQLEEFIATDKKEVGVGVVFNYLSDQGYLSHAEGKKKDENRFRIPNPEIRAALFQVLYDVLDEWKIDVKSCARVINKLSKHDDEETLQEKMLAIQNKLKYNLKKLESVNPDYGNEARIMCALYGVMNKSGSFEIAVDSHMKIDGKRISSGRPDYLLLHKSSDFCILWELKYNKEEKDGKKNIKKTSKYALQEARGKEPTRKKKFKDYMKAIKKLKRDALFIGLTVDGNFNVSLSYASKNEPKIFCITKKENELHSDYYSGCTILPEKESDSNNDSDSDTQ